MNVIIRKATEQDFPAILNLIKEFSEFQGAPEKVTNTAEQMAEDKTAFQCIVAEAGSNGIVGFATYFPAYFSWSGKALYLDDLYVKEAHRKRGVGKKLLDAVIDQAEREECRKVRWQVSRWNTNAIGFYKSIGARIDEVELNCDLLLDTN